MRALHALPRSALLYTWVAAITASYSLAVLAITSRLCIRVAAQNMNSTLQLALSLRVVARCGARRLADALMPSELGRKAEYTRTHYTPLVKSIHGLISTFSPVGRLFGTSRPNTLVCGHRSQSGSFLIWRHYRASKLSHSVPSSYRK